jgi:dimeric dUTPase (all-alpha-NTP-PPase superfamily)
MNLTKLFEMQKVLRDRIAYNEPDRFNKLVLALLVELGECANEWRGFKFWSKDQEPRLKVIVNDPQGQCEGYTKYPLLEEYVDGLHFVLELGIELEWDSNDVPCKTNVNDNVEVLFIGMYHFASELIFRKNKYLFHTLFGLYQQLGEKLGFTCEQIEQAYYAKNAINHERQDNGY